MRTHDRAAVALMIVLGGVGCDRTGIATDTPQPRDGVPSASNLSPSPPLSSPDQQIGTFYLHDFGMVLPGQVSRHRFSLTNPTASAWSFAKLIPSCSCTVAKTSAPVIAPSKSEWIEVEYKAPNSNGNDRRKVGVQFAEPNSPIFWLEVKA